MISNLSIDLSQVLVCLTDTTYANRITMIQEYNQIDDVSDDHGRLSNYSFKMSIVLLTGQPVVDLYE